MSEAMHGQALAIVIPWFGRELRGGAELQAWNLATRLTARKYAVEVLTTCCGSFQEDWSSNRHPAGLTVEPEGFTVRRFPVETRDRAAFDRVCGHLLGLDRRSLKPGVSPVSLEDERIFCEQLIRCPALLTYLEAEGRHYSAFIFLPYLYGPILDGLPLVASRAFLQPCLHDEAYAYLHSVQRVMYAARGLLWLSQGEYEFGVRLLGPSIHAKSVVGMAGVEPLANSMSPHTPPVHHPHDLKPFVLLLGRKDPGKGTLLAVEAFQAHHRQTGSRLQLVIAGPGELALADPENHIHDLGLVSEAERGWLLQHATALLQPSPNESFSRVMFEAWQSEKPVIVRRSCLATSCAVETCQGGWVAETTQEWTARLAQLALLSKDELDAVGRRGAAYAARTADWEKVMDRYDDALRPFANHAETMIRVQCALSARKPQRVRLLVGNSEAGAWDLAPGQVCATGWLEQSLADPDPILRFESDQPAGNHHPGPPLMEFSLSHLAVEADGATVAGLSFARGWGRSEGGPGTPGPRWATRSAEVAVQFHPAPGGQPAIHQVLSNLAYGDAIGNHAIWIRDKLQAMGFVSEIFARHIAPEMVDQAYCLSRPESLPSNSALLYHHSIGTEITPWVCRHHGAKALIYHNITPAGFFEPYRPDFAEICRHGRTELPSLASHFPVSAGDSRFNASELAACGFNDPEVLPLCIDPLHWASPPDERVMTELQDGRTNILFVGRIVPNKRHEELIYTFKFWLEDDPAARLFLVGTAEVSSFYLECLQELSRRLRVDHAVHFVGRVTDAELHAYYRCASMFWCLSEHEGFCVPLVEAMWFDVPVIAFDATAVGETMDGAGLLITDKSRCDLLAADLFRQVNDQTRRAALIASQRARRAGFLPGNVEPYLKQFIEKIIL